MDSPNAITCPDCGGVMEMGFIPDHADGNIPLAMYWQAGEPQPRRFLGLFSLGWIKAKRSAGVSVRAIRCTHCGLLKLYALQPTPAVREETWDYTAHEGDDHGRPD